MSYLRSINKVIYCFPKYADIFNMKRICAVLFLFCAGAICIPNYVHAQTSGNEFFRQEGIASWYGSEFDGRPTASGEIFNSSFFTAAHPTLPFGTMLVVTNRHNDKKVTVRVNDRGPFVSARIIDVSRAAADELDMLITGTAPVLIESVDRIVAHTPARTETADPFWMLPPASAPVESAQAPTPVQPPEAPPAPVAVAETPPAAGIPPAYTPPPAAVAPPVAVAPPLAYTPPPQAAYVPPPAFTPPTASYAPPPANIPPPATYTPPPAPPPAYAPPPVAYTPPPVAVIPPPVYTPPPAVQAAPPPATVVMTPVITPAPNKLYRLQVGSFRVARNAVDAFERLKNVGLNPAYERSGEFFRVVLAGIPGSEVQLITPRIGAAGFREVLIREER